MQKSTFPNWATGPAGGGRVEAAAVRDRGAHGGARRAAARRRPARAHHHRLGAAQDARRVPGEDSPAAFQASAPVMTAK